MIPSATLPQLKAEPTQPTAHRSAVLAMLIAAYIFNFLDRQILGILASSIKADLGLTDTDIGKLGGLAFALFYTGLGIPVAIIADRWSRTWIMTGALTLWSGFTAACGLATGFASLFLCRMGVGVGEAGGVAPAYSLISDYYPKGQRARALAVYSFGIPVGSAAGLLFGGLIAHKVSWRAAFFAVGAAGLLLAPLFRLVVREPPRVAPKPANPPVGATFRALLAKPSFWLLAFGAASSSVCGYGVAFWLPSFCDRSLHLDLVDRSLFLSAIALFGGVAGIWSGGWLADRMGKKSVSVYPVIPAVAFLLATPLSFAALNTHSLALAFVCFLIPQALNLVWLGPILTSVQHLVAPAMRSTASAAFLLVNNLLGIAGGIYYFGKAADLLKPHFGAESLRYALYSGLAFYPLGSILFFIAARRLARDWID
ncbi:MAG: major facilitator family transporter [Myxococcales bacterium]|nr:major facilitator family transporter [Myxococcales bacterium]